MRVFAVVSFVTRFPVVTEVTIDFLATNFTRFLCLTFLLKSFVTECSSPLLLISPPTTKYTSIKKAILTTIPHCRLEVASACLS